MDYVEMEGDSIDDAIERALQSLSVTRERVEIEILSNSTRGLFGIGGRKAKVRATLRPPIDLEPKVAPPRTVERPEVPERRRPAAAPAPVRNAAREPAPIDAAALERARAILQEIASHIVAAVQVEIESSGEEPRLTIEGDTSGILIGRRGQTLDALEYLINRIVSRDEDSFPRVIVDSQNYRIRRRDSLTELAKRVAERARKRGRTVTLNPMSPRDRRIVHIALRDEPMLVTRSAGTGYFRKLLIIPQSERRRNRSA